MVDIKECRGLGHWTLAPYRNAEFLLAESAGFGVLAIKMGAGEKILSRMHLVTEWKLGWCQLRDVGEKAFHDRATSPASVS